VIPKVHYDELQKGLSDERIAEIKEAGVVIIRGAVSKEVCCSSPISRVVDISISAQEALGWKQSIKDYIAENHDRVVGQFSILVSQTITTTHDYL